MNELKYYYYAESAKHIPADRLLSNLFRSIERDAKITGISKAELIADRGEFLTEVGIPTFDEKGKILSWECREEILIKSAQICSN